MTDYALLWLDLETTGLDPDLDGIIEVAWQVQMDYPPSGEMHSRLVWPRPPAVERWRENQFVSNMHEASGLTGDWLAAFREALASGDTNVLAPAEVVAAEILRDIEHLADGGGENPWPIRIAGSGVSHFDMAFLRRHMPALHARLDWRPMDVGQLEEWADVAGIPPFEAPEGLAKTHRAADDIRYHQAELAYYLGFFRQADA